MTIQLNGEPVSFETRLSLADCIGRHCARPEHVIAELNGAIIPRDRWADTHLKDGDALELVTLVGGG